MAASSGSCRCLGCRKSEMQYKHTPDVKWYACQCPYIAFYLSDLCKFLAHHVTLWYKKKFKHFRKQPRAWQTASLNRRRRQRGYENYLFTKKYVLIWYMAANKLPWHWPTLHGRDPSRDIWLFIIFIHIINCGIIYLNFATRNH